MLVNNNSNKKKSSLTPSSSALLNVPPRAGPVALLPPEASGREVSIIQSSFAVKRGAGEEPTRLPTPRIPAASGRLLG